MCNIARENNLCRRHVWQDATTTTLLRDTCYGDSAYCQISYNICSRRLQTKWTIPYVDLLYLRVPTHWEWLQVERFRSGWALERSTWYQPFPWLWALAGPAVFPHAFAFTSHVKLTYLFSLAGISHRVTFLGYNRLNCGHFTCHHGVYTRQGRI